MDKRDDTQREVLLDECNEPITSLDALVEQCQRALNAQLWMTCCWPEGSGWKIGDFNYLVVSVAPDADTRLYVQFWSEPGERVSMEIASGEWCPGAIRYIGQAQRQALEARGYALGGRARNYGKQLVIDSSAAAEAAALEALQIFFEVFGYPAWLKAEMDMIIPDEVLKRFGTRRSTWLNGSYWELPVDKLDDICFSLRLLGWEVTEAPDLNFS